MSISNDRTYTIRPVLVLTAPGGEHEFVILFGGDIIGRFHDREHAVRTLTRLSVIEFRDTADGTCFTIHGRGRNAYAATEPDKRHAVRGAARWAAANEHQWDYQTYEIPDVDVDLETGIDADGNEPCDVGDIIATEGRNLAICTPAGRWWDITEADALNLIQRLSAMLLDGADTDGETAA